MNRLTLNAYSLLAAFCLWFGIGFASVGPLALLFSGYCWAKDGNWAYYDNAVILWLFDGFRAWLDHPDSWHGLHSIALWIFRYLPGGLLTIPPGFALAIGGAILSSNLPEEKEAKPVQTLG
jgi:hypothetical protein